MKLLLEQQLAITKNDILKFMTMSAKDQLNYAKTYLQSLPNYNIIKPAMQFYLENLLTEGIDIASNPFMTFINQLEIPLSDTRDEKTLTAIRDMILNGNLNPSADYLNDKTLYLESDNDNAYKIKLITFVSNPKLSNTYNIDISLDKLKDGNQWKSASDMEIIFNDWVKESKATNKKQSSDDESLEDKIKAKKATGEDILRSKLAKYTDVNIRNYIKALLPEMLATERGIKIPKAEISNKLDSGVFDDDIDKLLSSKIYSAMGRDIFQVLDTQLLTLISNSIEKALS